MRNRGGLGRWQMIGTPFGRPMTIHSAGVSKKEIDFIQDGGERTSFQFLSFATIPTSLISHYPPPSRSLFLLHAKYGLCSLQKKIPVVPVFIRLFLHI